MLAPHIHADFTARRARDVSSVPGDPQRPPSVSVALPVPLCLRVVLLITIAHVLVACAQQGRLLVVVTSDIPLAEMDSVVVRVGRDGDSSAPREEVPFALGSPPGTGEHELPLRVAVEPTGGRGLVRVEAVGRRGSTEIVAARAAVNVRPGPTRRLPLILARDCLMASCDPDATCVAGSCEPVRVVEFETLPGVTRDTGVATDSSVTTSDAGGGGAVDAATSCGGVGATCAAATSIGSVAGDETGPELTLDGQGEAWLRVQVTEADAGLTEADLSATIELSALGSVDYDLQLYCVDCGGSRATSARPAGETDILSISVDDNSGLGGEDDTFTVVARVLPYLAPGACEPWRLIVRGNTGGTLAGCAP
jgi:hypothetical protein